MKADFIKNTAELIFDRHKESLKDIAVVFPSRRAGMYFKKELSELLDTPVWSPSVYSLNDFVSKFSELETADTLTLVFELYGPYSKHLEAESFDEFYPWGEMLLKDFDVIDKYLVNSDLLFRSIKNEKEIEQTFPIEVVEQVKTFWSSVINLKQQNEYREKFLNIWENLNSIYKSFRESLLAKKIAYEGLSLRHLSENIGSIGFAYKKIYFAGFNSLSRCERNIIEYLKGKNIGETLWDADKYFVDDAKQEAGFFIRKNLKYFAGDNKDSGLQQAESSLLTGHKNIRVTGSSLTSGMVKSFGIELKKFLADNPGAAKNTAVVLPDENALLPVLYSLPDNAEGINITMGLPFRSTPLFALVRIIQKLQSGKIFEKGKYKFYHEDVIRLLLHPYIKYLAPDKIFPFIRDIKETNIAFAEPRQDFIKSLEEGTSKDILELLFKPVYEVKDIMEYISSVCDLLMLKTEETAGSSENKMFQLEYLYFLSANLNRLMDIIEEKNITLNQTTFWNLLVQQLNSSRIVFTGEPMIGLQVMGLLESRNIKFENIFILSMNEGVMPAGNTFNSYIPYNLRKAFGLPTYEENDSINAYHIYSLISKAENVFLFYDTEIGSEVKEKSRYILQIENELRNTNRNIEYSRGIATFKLSAHPANDIVIKKDKALLEKLKENVVRLSPSDLNAYINCTLQFYFKKVLKLGAEEKVEEVLSAASFGTLFHEILQNLYKPYKDKTITVNDLSDIADNVNNSFDKIFGDVLFKNDKLKNLNLAEKGRNTLYKSVLEKLVNRFLDAEKKRAPFKVLELEKWLSSEITCESDGTELKIEIVGKADRIDEAENTIVVIDYKTGDSKLRAFKNDDKFYENLFANPDYKYNFQTLFYAYMMYLANDISRINAGIYAMKEISTGGLQLMAEKFFDPEDVKLFGSGLKNLIDGIFSSENMFEKTNEVKRCEYCDYKSICGR
ncbi:MAG: PD-(D/E)XK nuclease family protein [Bacteroidetes bacterium]|nr:PD-(D/E)XK nuclease family protein [Bacteroidota bacterium]